MGPWNVIAYLYPGQGAQRPGMLHSLPREPSVVATLDAVSQVLGDDVRDLDTAGIATDTVAAQLGLLTVGVAVTRLLAADGIEPDIVAGHSIGAFAAAVTAGVLTLEEGVRAVRTRAEKMRDCYPSGYGLLALIGTRLSDAGRLVAENQGTDDLFVAMENSEDQVVLAGSDDAFTRVRASAARFGIRDIRHLDVAVPSHCALMTPVADAVAQFLDTVPVRRPTVPYVSAMTARRAWTGAAVREDLAGGVAHMVRWRDATELLVELGTSVVVQLPPGHATAAMFAPAHPDVPVVAIDDAPFADSFVRLRRLLPTRVDRERPGTPTGPSA
jgi:malonate decarboxylase epsilon subunit